LPFFLSCLLSLVPVVSSSPRSVVLATILVRRSSLLPPLRLRPLLMPHYTSPSYNASIDVVGGGCIPCMRPSSSLPSVSGLPVMRLTGTISLLLRFVPSEFHTHPVAPC
jgi:hypothetical protein